MGYVPMKAKLIKLSKVGVSFGATPFEVTKVYFTYKLLNGQQMIKEENKDTVVKNKNEQEI